MMELDGPRLPPRSGRPPRQIVVICHGHGARGRDVIHYGEEWAAVLPDALFLAPDAPDVLPINPDGRRWFDLTDRTPALLDGLARRPRAMLDAYIDAELAQAGLAPDAYALFGMSQGAMMALFTGLRRPTAPRGILAYSGALVGIDTLPQEITHRPPVLLVHGRGDEAVPFELARRSELALRALRVPVETYYADFGHWITPEGIAAGTAFLRRVFAGAPA